MGFAVILVKKDFSDVKVLRWGSTLANIVAILGFADLMFTQPDFGSKIS